jgi:hypothetical protein
LDGPQLNHVSHFERTSIDSPSYYLQFLCFNNDTNQDLCCFTSKRLSNFSCYATGFGKLVAERLAKKGSKLVLSDLNEKNGNDVVNALNSTYGKDTAIFVKCDVSDSNQLKSVFDKGVQKFGRLDVSRDGWTEMVDCCFLAELHTTVRAIRHHTQHLSDH